MPPALLVRMGAPDEVPVVALMMLPVSQQADVAESANFIDLPRIRGRNAQNVGVAVLSNRHRPARLLA